MYSKNESIIRYLICKTLLFHGLFLHFLKIDVDHFIKDFIEFVIILLLFYVLAFWSGGM